MNSNERERLKRIRERAQETPHYFTADFHFLLALLDSQAAGSAQQWTREFPQREGFYFIRERNSDKLEDVVRVLYALGAFCAYRTSTDRILFASDFRNYEFLGPITPTQSENTATNMRTRCVEKVKAALADEQRK